MILRKETKVFVQLGYTDMRKQINGLSAIVQHSRQQGPFDGAYYVFCGKTKKVIKILYWDRTGFCLWLKRLEQDSFPWPNTESDLTEVTRNQIKLLLRGIDIWRAHKEVCYSVAG
ncbi:MAG: transposase [Treponema sp.]|nr:MAG: transposase [Treponema sp.]